MTFNILHGRSPVDAQVDLTRFRETIQELDPDILALQEVDRDQPRSHRADLTALAGEVMGAQAQRFAAALAGTPGATWVAATGDELPGSASYGIALLSRYPARTWQVLRLPRLPMRVPVWLPDPRKIVVVREEPRAALVGQFETPSGLLAVANTHLSFVPGWNRVQLRRIRRDLAGLTGPLVLMGDLNMTPPAPVRLTGYRSLAAQPTFPVDAPARQLDYVLLRDADRAEVIAVHAPLVALSDHRPLIVDITM